MRLPDPAIERLLETWPVARLATLGAAGRLHQVPIAFARAGGRLWSPVDGKPKSGRELQRLRDLRRHPLASLLLDAYDEDWERLWWLRLEVRAAVVEPADPERDAAVREALAALRAKYPQYQTVPLLRPPPTLLCFELLRAASWCAGAAAVPCGPGPG